MAAPAAAKGEHNFVADAHNWEQRIKTENSAAQIWSNNWGSLYTKGAPVDYAGKIALLEAEIKKVPSASLATNTMMSFTGDKPFDEIRTANYGKKSFGKFEHISIPGWKEELDPKYRPIGGGFGTHAPK